MSETSYARVSAAEVIEAAGAMLARRAARIEREREELIADQMRRRFFPAKTREQAIKRLQSDHGLFSEWYRIENRGGYWADRVEALRRLALASTNGEVLVSSDDIDLIHNHRERMKEQG